MGSSIVPTYHSQKDPSNAQRSYQGGARCAAHVWTGLGLEGIRTVYAVLKYGPGFFEPYLDSAGVLTIGWGIPTMICRASMATHRE
jgi:hypothetical protein